MQCTAPFPKLVQHGLLTPYQTLASLVLSLVYDLYYTQYRPCLNNALVVT